MLFQYVHYIFTSTSVPVINIVQTIGLKLTETAQLSHHYRDNKRSCQDLNPGGTLNYLIIEFSKEEEIPYSMESNHHSSI